MPGLQAADETRHELADHDAPRKPPVEIELVVVADRQHEAVNVREVLADVRHRLREAAKPHSRCQPNAGNERKEQPCRRHGQDRDEAYVRAGQRREQHDGTDQREACGVADAVDVARQVDEKQVAGERAGADDDDVVRELDCWNLEQLEARLDDAEVEGREKVKAPDEETPEAELERERVGEVVRGFRRVRLEVDERKHDQPDVEAGREQDRDEREQRGRHRAGAAQVAVAHDQQQRRQGRDDDRDRENQRHLPGPCSEVARIEPEA